MIAITAAPNNTKMPNPIAKFCLRVEAKYASSEPVECCTISVHGESPLPSADVLVNTAVFGLPSFFTSI